VAVLRRDIRNPVDRWDGERYERVLDLPEGLCRVSARQVGPPESPRLDLDIAAERDDLTRRAIRTIRTMLGVDLDLRGLYALADRDARLHRMVEPLRGMKPPRLASVFEALVSAVACQQLSLTAGMTIMARLADRLGRRPPAGDRGSFAFPRPDALAATSQDELRALGFSHTKARTLIGLARAVVDGALDLDGLAREPNATALARLRALPGIGPWSAEYALLRGLGRLDVFPVDDVGAANALAHRLNMRSTPTPARVREITARWGEWRGAVYLHLLGLRFVDSGQLASSSAAETQ
jgi:DNA-3-methyladenine glycosylase II